MDHTSKPTPALTPEKEEVLFKWDHQIKMLFNPVLWGNFVACFGIPITLLGLFLKFVGKVHPIFLPMVGILAFFAVIWFITGIVIDIGGGFAASFVITSRGIYFTSGPGSKKAADIATVIGLLAGSASGTGAGLLARAEQDNAVEWEKIKKVKVRKGMRYIFVRGSFGNKPIGLYCNKENFDQVLALVQSKFKG